MTEHDYQVILTIVTAVALVLILRNRIHWWWVCRFGDKISKLRPFLPELKGLSKKLDLIIKQEHDPAIYDLDNFLFLVTTITSFRHKKTDAIKRIVKDLNSEYKRYQVYEYWDIITKIETILETTAGLFRPIIVEGVEYPEIKVIVLHNQPLSYWQGRELTDEAKGEIKSIMEGAQRLVRHTANLSELCNPSATTAEQAHAHTA